MSTSDNIYYQLKKNSQKLVKFSEDDRRKILNLIADALLTQQDQILLENVKDIEAAKKNNLSPVIMDRLLLDKKRIESMSKGCIEIASQSPVLGFEEGTSHRPSGIHIRQQRIPLGMLAMVFESRPNVVIDALALAIKSGNGMILKGGKEAHYSNNYLFNLVCSVFEKQFKLKVFHYLDSREEFHLLLKQNKLIDLVIARGGSSLVNYVKQEATMPVMSHDKGLCHIYVHHDANQTWVNEIVLNAKISRPSVCNALESLLLHKNYSKKKELLDALISSKVQVRGCSETILLHKDVIAADEKDFDTEYLDKILSVKIVADENAAIEHVVQHTSHHTEGIIATDPAVIEKFMNFIDASCIVINSSTRFNDGGELGLGAELGISTSKFHAYGPVGAKQMTVVRFVVQSNGKIR